MARHMADIWNQALFDTVEGNIRMDEIAFIDGKPVLVTHDNFGPKAKPDLALLATLLRSEIELTPEIRTWLANLVDPSGTGNHGLQFKRRPNLEKKIKAKELTHDWRIAEFVEARIAEGIKTESVITEAQVKFKKKSRSTILAALKSLRAANASLDESS